MTADELSAPRTTPRAFIPRLCVPRIRGFYEYDDDLTPGKKKGGLHQNLFDDGGKLRPDRPKREDRRTRPAERKRNAGRRAQRRDEHGTKPDRK